MRLLLAATVAILPGCSALNRDLGIAGREPGEIACRGSIELSGSGSFGSFGYAVGANEFRLSLKCPGEGAYLRQGPPSGPMP